MAEKRIRRELEDLQRNPISNCGVRTEGDDLFKWVAWLMGPEGSPCHGCEFFLAIQFPTDCAPPLPPPGPALLCACDTCVVCRSIQAA
jgi:ubiquitin-protein ligase